MGTRVRDKHKDWSKQPAYRKAYEAFAPEFEVASAVIEARIRAGLSQAALANKIGTKQPAIARIEGCKPRGIRGGPVFHWASIRRL